MKNMSISELKELIRTAQAELETRQPEENKLVLYTHNCKDSSNHHMGKYKHWAKHVTSVDVTKTTGYAFGGDFLKVDLEHKLPVDALVVEVCDRTITLYRITETGKEELDDAKTNSMSSLIERAAKELLK